MYDITTYDDKMYRQQVVDLWRLVFGYEKAHNEPNLAIDKKIAVDDGLFFVALHDTNVVGAIMAGYDGHRGWIYSMSVHPEWRNRDIGSRLLARAEEELQDRGCMKVNLQVLADNRHVQSFYEAHGYATEERISMGKRLLE